MSICIAIFKDPKRIILDDAIDYEPNTLSNTSTSVSSGYDPADSVDTFTNPNWNIDTDGVPHYGSDEEFYSNQPPPPDPTGGENANWNLDEGGIPVYGSNEPDDLQDPGGGSGTII